MSGLYIDVTNNNLVINFEDKTPSSERKHLLELNKRLGGDWLSM